MLYLQATEKENVKDDIMKLKLHLLDPNLVMGKGMIAFSGAVVFRLSQHKQSENSCQKAIGPQHITIDRCVSETIIYWLRSKHKKNFIPSDNQSLFQNHQ